MAVDAIEFPVFVKGKDFIHFAEDEASLSTCTRCAYKSRYFMGMEVLDADGNMYTVQDARRIGYAKILTLETLFMNPLVRLQFKLKRKGKMGFEEARAKLLRDCKISIRELDLSEEQVQEMMTANSIKLLITQFSQILK